MIHCILLFFQLGYRLADVDKHEIACVFFFVILHGLGVSYKSYKLHTLYILYCIMVGPFVTTCGINVVKGFFFFF